LRGGKAAAARGLQVRRTKSTLDSLIRELPAIDWDDGGLGTGPITTKSKKGPGVGSQQPIDTSLPHGSFGKLKANWVGVDVGYASHQFQPSAGLEIEPSIELSDASGATSVRMRRSGDVFVYFGESANKARLLLGDEQLPGRIVVRAGNSQGRILLDATDSSIAVRAPDGGLRGRFIPSGQGCQLKLWDDDGKAFALLGDFDGFGGLALGGADRFPGRILLRKGNYEDQIVLDAESGDITLTNADCAEEFDLTDPDAEAGTVLVLAEDPGRLRPSDSPYDTRVAGVISGAGALRPGIVLDRRRGGAGRRPVALVGKVLCRVEADSSPVRPGALLTTSNRKGCAMAATDRERAFGAVLGKALAPLERGCDLLPVLVALQ
jgi:hypothetical protein